MKSHEIAKKLLENKNVEMCINGYGFDEGLGPFKVDCFHIGKDRGWFSYVKDDGETALRKDDGEIVVYGDDNEK